MAILTIDEKQYDLDKVSADAKAKVDSARFCEKKIEQLEAELAIVRTARAAYLQALPGLLTDDALISDAEEPKSSVSPETVSNSADIATKH